MRTLSLLLFSLCFVSLAMAQNGSITGTVSTQSSDPLMAVTVQIKTLKSGVFSDENGNFILNKIPVGTYIVSFSSVGFKTKELTVSVTSNTTTNLNNTALFEGNEILQEVVVTGSRLNSFSRKKSAYVSKLPLKNIENSQVYSTITNELLVSQIVTNFEDALKNTVGLEKLWSSTGRNGDGAGYYSLRGFNVQPRLVNGIPGLTNGKINPSNIERIEIIKGPSATLFGSTVTSYGGLINVVTKKPYVGFGGQVSYSTGSYGFNRINVDVNTPLDKEKDIYFRINTSYQSEDSFQDAGFQKSFFVAPSLSYKVNNKLSFSLYSEIATAEQTNPTSLFLNRSVPVKWNNLEELNYNNKKSLTSNELTIKNPTANYRAEMDYKISERWHSQTIVSSSRAKSDGYYSYLWNDEYTAVATPFAQAINPLAVVNPNTGTFSLRIKKENAISTTFDIQQNFIGDFKIANLRNRLVIGVDYFSNTQINNSNRSFAFVHNVNAQGDIVNYDNPDTDDFNPFTTEDIEETPNYLTQSSVDNLLSGLGLNNQKTRENVFSTYISDVINITPAISVMAGLRLDIFDNKGDLNTTADDNKEFTETTISPKFGIVYQPILDKLSFFVNYQNGFQNVPLNTGVNPVQTFKPEQANQAEIGAKANLFNGRLNATLSYYNIKVSDMVYNDPTDITPADGFLKIQNGEAESKGFEIEINATPLDGWNIRAGFSHNNSELIKGDASLIGRRPSQSGPEDLYNFWTDYKFLDGALEGFGIGAGFNGASDRFIMNTAKVGQFTVPSYTIANASIYYDVAQFRIGLKLNNLLNKEYYKGWTTISPQQPRTLLAQFSYKF